MKLVTMLKHYIKADKESLTAEIAMTAAKEIKEKSDCDSDEYWNAKKTIADSKATIAKSEKVIDKYIGLLEDSCDDEDEWWTAAHKALAALGLTASDYPLECVNYGDFN